MTDILLNFTPEEQEFILQKEKELGWTFVGCLESDTALVFKGDNVGDIKIVDIEICDGRVKEI